MSSALAFFLVAVPVLLVRGAPTTFPYENEDFVPPDMPAATPDYTYDGATDTGGYHYTHIWNMDYNEMPVPFCGCFSDCNQYSLVVTYKLPPTLAAAAWNCTANGLKFASGDFTGVVTGKSAQTLCNLGECCTDYIGYPKFSEDQPEWHNWLNTLASTGLCGDLQTEAMYCGLTNGHFQANCYARYPSGLERLVTLPCPDSYFHYWMEQCPVYRNVLVQYGLAAEPPLYRSKCTLEEELLVELSTEENDHICHPWSYYFPVASQGSAASAVRADDTTDSSAMALFSVLIALFISL